MMSLRVAPEWSYRRFLDSESSSPDKKYAASGYFGLGAHVDLFPFAARAGALRDFGLLGSYGRAIGLGSTDIDTQTNVGTVFYRFDAGLQYRLPSRSALLLKFSAAGERWVFDFDAASVQGREMPTARYSLARVGTDARFAVGSLALFGGAELMLPISIAPLGDREPSAGGFGARAKLGVAFELSQMFAIDLGASYTILTFRLPSVPGLSDSPGTVLDQYFVTSLGLTLTM